MTGCASMRTDYQQGCADGLNGLNSQPDNINSISNSEDNIERYCLRLDIQKRLAERNMNRK